MLIRKATMADVPGIHKLVNGYAQEGLMLRRPLMMLYERAREFCVAVEGDQLLGTGGLEILWHDLGEVRSLAVSPAAKGKGVGKAIVEFLVQEARDLGLKRVFALTYQVEFFQRCGFAVVQKEQLPQKVWKICVHCDKFNACDEVAMIRYLVPPEEIAADPVYDDSVQIPLWVKP